MQISSPMPFIIIHFLVYSQRFNGLLYGFIGPVYYVQTCQSYPFHFLTTENRVLVFIISTTTCHELAHWVNKINSFLPCLSSLIHSAHVGACAITVHACIYMMYYTVSWENIKSTCNCKHQCNNNNMMILCGYSHSVWKFMKIHNVACQSLSLQLSSHKG